MGTQSALQLSLYGFKNKRPMPLARESVIDESIAALSPSQLADVIDCMIAEPGINDRLLMLARYQAKYIRAAIPMLRNYEKLATACADRGLL